MRLELATESIDLAPGEQVEVDVRVLNDSADAIDVQLGIAGLDSAGVRPVAELGVLPPGATASTRLHFALPKGAAAGLRDIAIHAVDKQASGPTADQSRQIAHVTIRVGSTERLSLKLQRSEVRGRFKGKIRADLRNQGDQSITLRLWGEGDDVAVKFARDVIELPPGHSARVKGRVRIPGLALRGDHRRAFVVTAQGASTPATTSGSYVKRGVLPASLFALIAIIVVLALWITGLVYFQHRLRGDDEAKGGVVTTTTTTLPDGSDGTPGTGTNPDGTPIEGAPGTGTPGNGEPPGAGGEGGEGGEVVTAPVKIVGAVDGPSSRGGTNVVLELIQLGKSSAGSGEATMSSAFASVRQVGAPVSEDQSTVTDEAGQFKFNIVKTPALYRVTVFRTGFDVSSQVVNIDGAEKNIDLTVKLVPAAGRIGGRVLDAAGAALGGVAVTVSSGDLRYSTTTADGTGSWELLGVATPATYVIQFAKQGFAAASLIQSLDGGGVATNLLATMTAGLGTVRGEVQVGRVGIGGLTVTLDDGVNRIVSTTRTDDPVGTFEFPGVKLGNYSLTITGQGWQTFARQVALKSGLEDVGIIELVSSTAVIRGVVTQEALSTNSSTCVVPLLPGQTGAIQQPCGGVGITATQGSSTFRTTSSSVDGSFLLSGIPAGDYTLTFERFGYTTVTLPASVALGRTLTVDPIPGNDVEDAVRLFVAPRNLLKSGTLLLNITSSAGLALTGSAFMIDQQADTTTFATNAGDPADTSIQNLFPGLYQVKITAAGHDDFVQGVQIPLNAASQVYDIVLTPLGSVSGTVTDSVDLTVAPVGGAVVFLSPVDTASSSRMVVPPLTTPSSVDATYLHTDPAVGEIRLCERNIAAPGATADLRIGLCARTDNTGRYNFPNAVRVGDYNVYAPTNEPNDVLGDFALDHRLTSDSVTTALNTLSTVNLLLPRLGAVIGTVRTVDPSDGVSFSTLDDFTVTAFMCESAATTSGCAFPASNPVNTAERGRVTTAAGGLFRVDRLAPAGFDPVIGDVVGKYILQFQAVGFVDLLVVVDAPALNTDAGIAVVMLPKPIQVGIRPYFTLAGTTDPLPVPGATVTFRGIVDYTPGDSPTPIYDDVTDTTPSGNAYDSGNTVFLAGDVDITISAPGFDTVTTSVTLDPSGASPVEVENQITIVDPGNPDRMLLSADVRVPALLRSVFVDLNVQCCGSTTAPTNDDVIFAAIEAILTLDALPTTTVSTGLDADGLAQFSNIDPGAYTLTFGVIANAIGLDGNITLPAPQAVNVQTSGDATVPVQVATVHPATVSGTITDADEGGAPLDGATVSIDSLGISTTTDLDGEYSLEVGNVPGSYVITVRKADGRADCVSSAMQINPGEGKTFSRSCLGPRGTVAGSVQGKNNPGATPLPLDGATVELIRVGTGDVIQSQLSHDGGLFEFNDVPAGAAGGRTYEVRVTNTGFDPQVLPLPSVTVVANATRSPIPNPIVLIASSRTAPIRVVSDTQLLGADVNLAGVTVTATLSGASPVSGVTDANGLVNLALQPGNWTITTSNAALATATANNYRTPHLDESTSINVNRGVGAIASTKISLEGPFLRVTGVVQGQLNPTATPASLAGAVVSITTSFGTVQADPTIGDGSYEFTATAPVGFGATTAATITASATGYVTSTPRAESLALSSASPTVALSPIVLAATAQSTKVTVHGRESNTALKGVTVTATLVGSAPPVVASGVTDSLGAVLLSLVPGSWSLVTSNGVAATDALNAPLPHGDVIGSVTVAFNTTPATTPLTVAALVAVGGSVTSLAPVAAGFTGVFDARALNGASITIDRVGAVSPAEPVNSYVATSSAGAFAVLNGLTPGTWDIAASAAGHTDQTIQIVVTAGVPVSTANLQLDELPLQLSGTVTDGVAVGMSDVTVTFVSGGVSGSVLTDVSGAYSIALAASEEWTVGFDPSTSAAASQNIPVLYRFVGPAQGGTTAQLDHVLFTDVVELRVTVKGVLPAQCSEASCIEHDLGVSAEVTLVDTGNVVAQGREASVQFPVTDTTTVSSVQVATFGQVPNLSTYTLSVTAEGYAAVADSAIDLDAAPCAPPDSATRCVTIRLVAIPRAVDVTVTDLAGQPVTSAGVQIKSKPGLGTISLSCTSATDVNGTCTVAGVVPAFGPYPAYDIVVTPQSADPWGHLVSDLTVLPGVGAATATVNTVPIKPAITVAPTAVTAWDGDNVSFTATATGNPAPTVVWKQIDGSGTATTLTVGAGIVINTAPATGGTTSTITLSAVAVAKNNFNYRAEFSNTGGGSSTASLVASANALLKVARVTPTAPLDGVVWDNEDVTFIAAATGATTTVQWERQAGGTGSWTAMSGKTSLTLTFDTGAGTPLGVSGDKFRAVFTLAGATTGTRTSREALLTTSSNPSNPIDTSAWSGTDASFTSTSAAGMSIQWQVQLLGSGSFTNIVGETSSTLTLTGVTASMNTNKYRAVHTAPTSGTVKTSTSKTLTVKTLDPVFPEDFTAWAGNNVTFASAVAPTGGVSVQWKVATAAAPTTFTNVGTGTSLTLNSVTTSMNGNLYKAVVTISGGGPSIETRVATLNVVSVTSSPADAVVWEGSAASFTAAAGPPAPGGVTPTVQWQLDPVGAGGFADISGATNTTFNILSTNFSQSGNQYRAVFSIANVLNAGTTISTANSSGALLTVAKIVTQPVSASKTVGQTATFSTAASVAGFTVQWQVDDGLGGGFVNASGASATTPELSVTNVQLTMSGWKYRAIITVPGTAVTATTSQVVLTVTA